MCYFNNKVVYTKLTAKINGQEIPEQHHMFLPGKSINSKNGKKFDTVGKFYLIYLLIKHNLLFKGQMSFISAHFDKKQGIYKDDILQIII